MLDIFIIGPMQKSNGKNQLIRDILVDIFENLENKVAYKVKFPDELTGGYISENVFYEIDIADLVIADITGRSPNVFYEIAMLQSMGKSIIFIDSIEDNDEAIPFYLKHTNIITVKERNIVELKPALTNYIKQFLNPTIFTNYSTSVISQYYGLPLVHISAVMGVAFGYYSNFIKPFLQRNVGAISQQENNISKLFIIKPSDLSSEDICKNQLCTLLKVYKKKTFICPASTRGHSICPFVKEDLVFDIPSAMFTLKKSPRLKKLKKRLSENQNVHSVLKKQTQNKFETQVIEHFFNYLEFLLQEEADDLNNAYEFITIDELKNKKN